MPNEFSTSGSTDARTEARVHALMSWAGTERLDGPALRDAIERHIDFIVDEAASDLARLYGVAKRRLVSASPGTDFVLTGCDLDAVLAAVVAQPCGGSDLSVEQRMAQAVVYARGGDGYTRIWSYLQDRASEFAGPAGLERARRNGVAELLAAEREIRNETADRAHWRRRPTARTSRSCSRPRGRRSSPARRRAAGSRSGSDPGDGPGEPPSSVSPARGGHR